MVLLKGQRISKKSKLNHAECEEMQQRKSMNTRNHDRAKDIKIEKIENIKLKKNICNRKENTNHC